MIDLGQASAFLIAVFILIVVPGPSVVFVISRSLAHGWRTGLATVIGNSSGLLAIVILVSVGLGPLVQRSGTALLVLKITGGAYLIWLGVQAVRARHEFQFGAGATSAEVPAAETSGRTSRSGAGESVWRSIRDGAIVGFSNPKGFVIFGA